LKRRDDPQNSRLLLWRSSERTQVFSDFRIHIPEASRPNSQTMLFILFTLSHSLFNIPSLLQLSIASTNTPSQNSPLTTMALAAYRHLLRSARIAFQGSSSPSFLPFLLSHTHPNRRSPTPHRRAPRSPRRIPKERITQSRGPSAGARDSARRGCGEYFEAECGAGEA